MRRLALPVLLAATPALADGPGDGEVITIVDRAPRQADDAPQVVDVIDERALELTAGDDLTDALKKNAGVDVVQYPGALSGIGLRGFRPEFSGVSKHSLLLIDGRPSGASNLATVPLSSIEQIEVMYGPASAPYGGQAAGGVINVVRRRSTGPVGAWASLGFGTAQTWQAEAGGGGDLARGVDFDVAASLDLRAADMRLGDGTVRPHTEYGSYFGRARTRARAGARWTAELDGDLSLGRDVELPGDVFFGDAQRARKDFDRGGLAGTAVGDYGAHTITLVGFGMVDASRATDLPADAPAHRSYDTELAWLGGQVRYTGSFDAHELVAGVDVDRVAATSRAYDAEGMPRAPRSPDNLRISAGAYALARTALGGGGLVNAGVRADVIGVETLPTPYKTDFTPGTASFATVSPSAGVVWTWRGLRPHASAGAAFVPPEAAEMAGYAEREVDGVVMVTRGNPDLRPERAWSADAGVGYERAAWGLELDATVFVTRVTDKIGRVQLTETELGYANVGAGRIAGWQCELGFDLGAALGWPIAARGFGAWTRIWYATEGDADIHNVADWNVRYGVELAGPRWAARALARYRGAMKDTDWNAAGYPEVVYPTWTVIDVVGAVTVADGHRVTLELRNVGDVYYYEKQGYPLMGRSAMVRYGIAWR